MSHHVVLPLLLLAFGAFSMSADSSKTEKAPDASINENPMEGQLLMKARVANGEVYSTLRAFVCREEIERFRGNLQKSKVKRIDHVSTDLSFENGIEHYDAVKQNDRSLESLPEIMGAWSEGEFGTLLQQTDRLLATQPVSFVSFENVSGVQTAIYRFEVSEKDSPWDLIVGTTHYKIPFSTDVWISAATGEILKIARKSISMPADTRISEIDWDVSLATVDLDGKPWLLPTAASYSVSYVESKRREWNEMSFSNYRRYGSESTLKFDGFK
jgi:hypothetical protein